MIYTCTITPSLDYTAYLPEFAEGKLNRTSEVFYYPGGKGINVSRVLKRLETSATALGYIGGFTGRYIEDFLKNEGVASDFIEVPDITRINVKVKSENETELNGPGPELTQDHLAALTAKVKKMEAGDWFILAGSLPSTIPVSYFKELAEICRSKDIRFVLDTSGSAFKEMLSVQPFLIKPNMEELGECFGTDISSVEEAHRYAKRLVSEGTGYVIVSMGAEGALLVSENDAFIAKAPKGNAVNTVGSGDSMVAGFVSSFVREKNPERAFRLAVACGSATAFRSDLCDKAAAENLLPQVKVYPFQAEDVTK